MAPHAFKHPVLGIFVRGCDTLHEHCFGAIFDRTVDGRIIDYRLISYIGTDMPPTTARSNEVCRTDGGILLPISPTAASHLIGQLDEVREELTAGPKRQRYYYAQRVKRANALQEEKGRTATNCVDFLIQAAQKAGINIGNVSDMLRDADRVDDVKHVIDEAVSAHNGNVRHVDAFLGGTTPMPYVMAEADRGTKALYFRTPENTTVLNAMNTLPREMIKQVSESKPFGQPLHRIERPESRKRLASDTGLASGPEFC